jgi:methyl-accepting chemotaxis protein
MSSKRNFRTQVLYSVVGGALSIVFAGSLLGAAFSSYQAFIHEKDTAEKTVALQLTAVQNVLENSATLMNARTDSAMKVLTVAMNQAGSGSAGEPVKVGDGVNAVDLILGDKPQAGNFEIVDAVTAQVGGTATLFSTVGDKFIRISTNVKKADGSRAVGTELDPAGEAIKAIRLNKPFSGVVDILGNPYFTKYNPISSGGNTVGIAYVGYQADVSGTQTFVSNSKVLNSGFLALVDSKGQVRFSSKHVDPKTAASIIKNKPADWELKDSKVDGWNYTIYSAYPSFDVYRGALTSATVILASGLFVTLLTGFLLYILLNRKVITPLGGEPAAVVAIMDKIANGDLNVEVPAAPAGSLMNGLDKMSMKLRNIVNSIQSAVASVVDNQDEFSAALTEFKQADAAHKPESLDKLIEVAKKVGKSNDQLSRSLRRLKL